MGIASFRMSSRSGGLLRCHKMLPVDIPAEDDELGETGSVSEVDSAYLLDFAGGGEASWPSPGTQAGGW